MATKLSPSTPRSKLQRGSSGLEADRTSPSTSKTMSSMFGDNSPKKRTPVSRGTELNQVQEELAKTREQLALMEKSKANLLHDLARSKRQVEELTAKLQDVTESSQKDRMRAEEMEHASFTAAEDWQVEVEVMKAQYEAAILELEANKQAMDSLNHELTMCVEARNEAVRLAGEAMNAAESTAKRVEDLSAELLAARNAIVAQEAESTKPNELKSEVACSHKDTNGGAGSCEMNGQEGAALLLAAKEIELNNALQQYMGAKTEIEGLKQDLALAQKSQMQLMDLNVSLEGLQRELSLSKEAEMKAGLQLRSLSSELDRVTNELADIKESERVLKSQLTTQQVQLPSADGKQSEEETSVAARSPHAIFDKASADMARIEESESATLASLAKVSAELEEAQEKLITVALEGAMFTTFLESLKAELAGNQAQLATVAAEEASARLRVDTISLELTKLREAHEKEAQIWNEKLASSNTAMELLRAESDRQKLESAGFTERESTVNACAEALRVELKNTQDEVMELKKQTMNACERGTALSKELENSQNEIMALREREMSMTYRIGALMDELEAKQLEASELSRRVEGADDKVTVLTASLENSLAELARLKEKESGMNSKAAALSVALASLSQQTESKLLELKEKEKGASVKSLALHEELRKISLEFEEALTDARVAREDATKLYESLQIANAERDQARRQEQLACNEATQSKKSLEVALAKAETANYELENAFEAVHAAEQRGLERALEAEVFQEKWQAAQKEMLLVKNETKSARENLQAALLDLERMSEELNNEKQEAQLVSQEVSALKAEILTVNGKAVTAMRESEAAKQELGKLKSLVEKAKSGEEGAQSALKTAESKLQDALSELEALKLGAASLVEHEEGQHLNDLTKAPEAEVVFSQEEFTDLNLRLQDMENCLAIASTELATSIVKSEKLSKELESVKADKERSEKANLDLRKLLADTEKVNLNTQVEMQRLLHDREEWQRAKDEIEIPAHSSEVNGCCFSPEYREDKKMQADFVAQILNFDLFPLNANGKDIQTDELFESEESSFHGEVGSREALIWPLEKEAELPEGDDGFLKDEVASQDEAASLPMRKKKKNLLGRLGTLLDKKKNSPQHTP